jgi:hypothetical protein
MLSRIVSAATVFVGRAEKKVLDFQWKTFSAALFEGLAPVFEAFLDPQFESIATRFIVAASFG